MSTRAVTRPRAAHTCAGVASPPRRRDETAPQIAGAGARLEVPVVNDALVQEASRVPEELRRRVRWQRGVKRGRWPREHDCHGARPVPDHVPPRVNHLGWGGRRLALKDCAQRPTPRRNRRGGGVRARASGAAAPGRAAGPGTYLHGGLRRQRVPHARVRRLARDGERRGGPFDDVEWLRDSREEPW
jgi:hypothetical protein